MVAVDDDLLGDVGAGGQTLNGWTRLGGGGGTASGVMTVITGGLVSPAALKMSAM